MARAVAVSCVAGTAWLAPPALAADAALSPAQEEAVRALVRDTLIRNPEILNEAMEALQAKQQAEEDARARAAIQQHGDALVAADPADVIGNPDGDVTIVEFSDYQCGYCKRAFPDLLDVVERDGNVRLVIRELPILGPESVMAARAAEASRGQGLYPEFHKALMAMKGGVSEASVMQVAAEVGLDVEQLRVDMADPALDEAFAHNIQLARALGVSGTPAFVIGDELAPGAVPAERLKAMIAAARGEG
jgi:protein-disulfide isomerase